jgi:hypothetical protein
MLKNTESGGENNVYDKITIKSEKTMKTAAEFDALCNAAAVKAWTNPFLSDSDASNDNNPYYIHICYRYTYNAITPLSNLTGGGLPKTKVMKSKALAYIAIEKPTCEANHVLVSKEDGEWKCAKPVLTYTRSAANCRWTEEDGDCLETEISVYSYSRSKGSAYESPRGDGKCHSDEANHVRLLAGLDGSCRGISSQSMNYCCEVSKLFTITFQ